MLSQHPFLTAEECVRTKESVHKLRALWINRGGGRLPFYTLGTASYLDASEKSDGHYRLEAERLNPHLRSHFSFLYERLCDALSAILNVPVSYAEGLGLPGFHIFLGAKVFERSIAATHFDVQFKSIQWHYAQVDFDHPISFTCPVAVPKGGLGLNYWDIEEEMVKEMSPQELEWHKKRMHFLPYALGKLVLHQGLLLHQIAPSKDVTPEDERITLQGHGLMCDGQMRLYW